MFFRPRVALGLPGQPPAAMSLADLPADLDQTFSSEFLESNTQIGKIIVSVT
jgi:hypothetical protein